MELLTFQRMLEIAHLMHRRGFGTLFIRQYLIGLKRGARYYHL